MEARTRVKRSLAGAVGLALASIGLTACGGSSAAEIRTIDGCKIKPATRCVGADLAGKDLRKARLPRADLRRADLRRADLRGANLTRADLRHAKLDGADLRGATLKRAKLGEAALVFANLTRASLQGADLSGASLLGATLTDAKVTRQALSEAVLCATTGVDGQEDNTDCEGAGGSGTSPTPTTPASPPVAPAPLTVERFVAPSTYSCGNTGGAAGSDTGGGGASSGERRQGASGTTAVATFQWSVPQAGDASFTIDGIRPSSVATNLPAIVENPEGQSFGDVVNGTVTIAFACNRMPHVVDFVWTQADALGVPIPGGPTVTRTATLTYVG